jgi:uncharacterized protein YbjT (DUF2867 family)
MNILVIGGTGLIGSQVVGLLRQHGHRAVPAAPSTGVDILTGKGLADAMAGVQVVIDVSNSPSIEDEPAMDFFRTAGGNITAAAAEAGVGHHIALSIVGTDRLQSSGYFRAKLAQEEQIRRSPIPYTLVRATQFFELIRTIADVSTDGTLVRLPDVQFQPMASRDVAAVLAELALGEAANELVEIAGPERLSMGAIVGRVLAHDHDPRHVVIDPAAGYFGVPVENASLVPASNARLGPTSLDGWLANAARPPVAAAT